MFRKPVTWVVVAVLAVAAAAGLYWFTPWKLFTNKTVHDTLSAPTVATSTSGPPSAAPTSATPAGPAVLAQGSFVSHEHPTTGTARIVRTPDGSRRLELVGLATSDGPDLRVWLTDRPVTPGAAGAEGFNKGRYLELGRLKGNRGDQVYAIPAGTDLGGYRSVTIWCIRFSVSFGAAELTPAAAA
jgi:hypothetical protein